MPVVSKPKLQGDAKKLTICYILANLKWASQKEKKFYRCLLINRQFAPTTFYLIQPFTLEFFCDRWILRRGDQVPLAIPDAPFKVIYDFYGTFPIEKITFTDEIKGIRKELIGHMKGFFEKTDALSFPCYTEPQVMSAIIKDAGEGLKKLSCQLALVTCKEFPKLLKLDKLELTDFYEREKTPESIFCHDIKQLKLSFESLKEFDYFKELSDSKIRFKRLEKLTVRVPFATEPSDEILPHIKIFHQYFPKFNTLKLKISVCPEFYGEEDIMEQIMLIYDDVLEFKKQTKKYLKNIQFKYKIENATMFHNINYETMERLFKESKQFDSVYIKYGVGEISMYVQLLKKVDQLLLEMNITLRNEKDGGVYD